MSELLTLRSNGIVTYRDKFAYATTREILAARIQQWLQLPAEQAAQQFKETRDRKSGPAFRLPFHGAAIERVSYPAFPGLNIDFERPISDFDIRFRMLSEV